MLKKLPQEFTDKVLKPMQAMIEIKNAKSSDFTLDLVLGGTIQKIFDSWASGQSLDKMGSLADSYISESKTLYSYGLSSPLERYVRQATRPGQPWHICAGHGRDSS